MIRRPAWYVFGVTPAGTALPAGADPAPLASSVERLAAGEIEALVSRVGRDELLGPCPQDPAWLLPRIEAHDRVLTAVAAEGPVVPFRFGMAYGSLDAVVEALNLRADELIAALRRIGDSQEWTVSIEAAAPRPVRAAPAGRGPRRPRSPGQPGEGRSYLLDRGADLTARVRADDALSTVVRLCRDWHIPATMLTPGPDGTGRLACLVPRAAAGQVVPRLAALTGIESGLRVTVRGPLPPHHFLDQASR